MIEKLASRKGDTTLNVVETRETAAHRPAAEPDQTLVSDGFWETKENFQLNIFSETRCSVKVFLGGVPWDLTEASLLKFLKDYGNILRNRNIFVKRLEMFNSIIIKGIKSFQWSSEDQKLPRKGRIGFVYIVLKESKMVNELVKSRSFSNLPAF